MKLLVVGDERRSAELIELLGEGHSTTTVEVLADSPFATEGLDSFDAVFDLNFDDNPDNLEQYAYHDGLLIVAGAVKKQLAEAIDEAAEPVKCHLVGMNTLPTFINRPSMEVSFPDAAASAAFDKFANETGIEFHEVSDRVGMVTPRVIFMIINEACYTVQEGTATMEDIDAGMKLGTNYPQGPFEWADKIGVKDVYETLDALYHDTHEERYRICPMLKTKYLQGASFLQ